MCWYLDIINISAGPACRQWLKRYIFGLMGTTDDAKHQQKTASKIIAFKMRFFNYIRGCDFSFTQRRRRAEIINLSAIRIKHICCQNIVMVYLFLYTFYKSSAKQTRTRRAINSLV